MRTLILAVALLSGCTLIPERTVYLQEPLPVPERPALPTVLADDLACLDAHTYTDLAVRDAVLRAHVERLEAIIETTHAAPKQ